MGTSCAVADVQTDRATIWSPTQSAYPVRNTVGDAARAAAGAACASSTSRGSGCYGINGADTVSYDAAILSQAVGRPVRVQLSRQDEMAWENYGFAYVDRSARRARRATATIVAWDCESVERGARRAARLRHARQRRHRHAARVAARAVRAARRAPPPDAFNNGSNAAPSYVTGCAGGSVRRHRRRSRASACSRTRSDRRSSPARSVRPTGCRTRSRTSRSWTKLAARVKADPVEYRLRHLRDPRLIDVVKAAAKARGMGHAAVAAARIAVDGRRERARLRVRAVRRRQRLLRNGRGGRGRSGDRPRPREATRRRRRIAVRSPRPTG